MKASACAKATGATKIIEIAGQDAELPEIRRRARYFASFVALAFFALGARLFYLQVVEGDTFYKLTSDSIVRTVTLPAVRGQIRDRKGRVLAVMRPSYDVVVTPHRITPAAFARLRAILGLDPAQADEGWERIEKERRRDRERSIVLAEDVSREAMAAIETNLDLAGVEIVATSRRHYPNGALAAHALGFMNEVSAEDLKRKKDEGYRPGDLIGRTGLERQWETSLRGQRGFEKVVVDRRGMRRADIAVADIVDGPTRRDPAAGNNVYLTLDLDVQRLTERALRAHRAAAAAVIDVETGRVIALASRPGFDPNTMSGRLSAEAEAKILSDRFRPLRDKTLNETFNPGSTFKVVSALAALEDKLVTPEERAKCRRFIELGGRRFRCTKTHLSVSLYEAIVQSCNVYFYELGARPGMMDRLAKYAIDMGLGAPTGLGINAEEGGFLPTEEWYREQKRRDPKHEGYQQGHALNTAIGEGSTRVTVTQMAVLYAAIANGGKLLLPQIVERVEAPDGHVVEELPPRVRRELSASPESLAFLRQALAGVVHETKGTAWKARLADIEVAGKTGTAQVRKVSRKNEAPVPPEEQNDHAWFAGFAPAGRPRIAFAVFVAHGGHGGEVAAPVAMEIVRGYFDAAAPADREAPRLGLLRRRARGVDRSNAAAPSASAAGHEAARP